MLRKAQEAVYKFHIRNGYAVDQSIVQQTKNHEGTTKSAFGLLKTSVLLLVTSSLLGIICRLIKRTALQQQKFGDHRLYRTWLVVEEFQEMVVAQSTGNEVDYADALGDLLYVVIGNGVTDHIPLNDVFEEIHRANMDKQIRKDNDPRMRDKGATWCPPNIKEAIHAGRVKLALGDVECL